MLNLLNDWRPGCFCAAIIKLCDVCVEEQPDEIARTPAQWAWFAWVPLDDARPFSHPQGWGISLLDPLYTLAEELGAVDLYLLKDNEVDWFSLLDILLVCDNSPPWLRVHIKVRQREQRQAARCFYLERYGGDGGAAFQQFMRMVLGSSFG